MFIKLIYLADHKPHGILVYLISYAACMCSGQRHLGSGHLFLPIPPTHPISKGAKGREVSCKQHAHHGCCTRYMLKLGSWFTTFAHKCIFGKYPTRGHFEHLTSNSIVNCSLILLYISLSQGGIAAPNCC